MAVKSMTGFGRGEAASETRHWFVEVRCVNNRYLDFKCKLPRGYASVEERIRKKVGSFHQRGRVDLSLKVVGDFTDLVKVKTNVELAGLYKSALEELAGELDLPADISAVKLSSFPDVLVADQGEENFEQFWPYIEKAVDEALTHCAEMRSEEGRAMVDDLLARVDFFTRTIERIEQDIPRLLEQRESALKERLEKLLDNVQLDPMRLAQEVAVIADKTDVTEEIVRLKSHIEQFKKFLNENQAVGRKLDFLVQEFLREVNTIASKINDASIAHLTVDLKGELEKMREQIQNIE